MDDLVIMHGEIIDADADKEAKSNNKETKIIPKDIICETKRFLYLIYLFIH